MAKDNKNGLYLPLSVDIEMWEQSLEAADAELSKEMKKMRSAMKDLRLRYDVEITGAKAAGDDARVLELETTKLNGLYIEQKNVLEALNRAYQKSIIDKGKDADATKYLAYQLVREGKELDRIKNQINARNEKQLEAQRRQEEELRRQQQRQLEEQKRQAELQAMKKNSARENIISGSLQMISPKLEGARRTLAGVTETLGDLGGTAGKVGGILSKFGGYVVGIGLVAGAFKLLKKQLDETRESILKASDNTYKLIEHLSDLADTTQLPINEVIQLSEACKIAGANIDAIAPALNRLDKAFLSGNSNLEKYGVKLTDSSGGLKSTTEQLEELANAYSNMKALGRGGEFVAELGKTAQALLPFISRLADADFNNVKEMVANAPKVSQMLEDDAKYIGELDRALEVLNQQLASAEGAEATQFKIDNVTRSIENAMEKMQAFNDTVDSRRYEQSGISALDDELHKFDKSIISAKSSLKALMSELQGYIAMRVAYGLDSIRNNSFEDFDDYQVRKSLELSERLNKRDNDRIKAQIESNTKPKTVEDENKKIREKIDNNYAYADAGLRDKLYTQEVDANAKKREADRQREVELAEKNVADLKKQLRDLSATEEERKLNAINDNFEKNSQKDVVLAEKIKQAELKKLAEEGTKKRIALEQKLTESTLSEKEKRINAIEKEYEANAKIDTTLADKIKQAELKRLQDEETKSRMEAMDKIRAITNSDFENKLQQIQKEKEAWIKSGADKVAIEQATQKQISDLYKQQAEARMSEAERLLTEQKQIIKDIQKGYSDSEIMERADKRYMKSHGFNQSMVDTLQSVGLERINMLADSRQRVLGRFGQEVAPQVQQVPPVNVTVNFDSTVVEDMNAMQKIADKVSDVITPAIEKAIRGESQYGY